MRTETCLVMMRKLPAQFISNSAAIPETTTVQLGTCYRSRCNVQFPWSQVSGQLHDLGRRIVMDTRMTLGARRYWVLHSKTAYDLEPPYGIEP